MGQAKSRLNRFKKEHPYCCYCGGGYSTESIDHAPPRTFFFGKSRPKGLEVPACLSCNRRFGCFDDFFALLSFTQASFRKSGVEPRFGAMVASIYKRFPEALEEISQNAKRGYILENTKLWRPGVKLEMNHPDIHFTINYSIARLAAAQYYDSKQVPMSLGAVITTDWYSNAQPLPKHELIKLLGVLPEYNELKQGKWSTDEQFQVRFNFGTDEENVGGCAFHFHGCFVGTSFIFPNVSVLKDANKERLFLVTKNGIEPSKLNYPKDVRLPERRPE